MQSIGKFSLQNQGGFVTKLQCVYWDESGNRIHCDSTSSFLIGQCATLDPGQANPPVPDGALVSLYAFVVGGQDCIGSPMFIYKQGSPIEASYLITGTTLNNSLRLICVALPTWSNWSKNIVHSFAGNDSESYQIPSTRAQLQDIVRRAIAAGITVRTSGQRHSQPPLVTADNRSAVPAPPKTWLVDLSCYADLGPNGDQRMILDATGSKVTVNTGVREDELDAFLTANNKMLQTVTAGGFFSLGGMTSVDVHGATVNAPIFAETASAFTLMGPDGTVTTVDENSPSVDGWEPIQFARVSLGALGIVTSITLDVLERPWATTLKPGSATLELRDPNAFVAQFKTLLETHSRMETFFNPYSNSYLVLWWDVDTSPATKMPNPKPIVASACTSAANDNFGAPYEGLSEPISELAGKTAQSSGSRTIASGFMDLALNTIQELFDDAAKSYSDLWLTKAARVIFMSYFIELPALDVTGLSRVWQGLHVVTSRLNTSTDFLLAGPMEFRFVQGGNTALAGTYTKNSNSTFVNLDLIGFVDDTEASDYPSELLRFFADIERVWVTLGGMPHNGKMYGFYDPTKPAGSFTAPFNQAFIEDLAKRRANQINAFEAYRQKCDPGGIFCNEFVGALLGHNAG